MAALALHQGASVGFSKGRDSPECQLRFSMHDPVMRVLHRPAPVGRISMMVVDESLRSQGIGAVLVAAAEEALAAQGCYMVEVTSHVRRTDAHRFYERIGYERTSVRLAKEL